MNRFDIARLKQDHPRYREVIVRASQDESLCREMWQDAELEWELDELTTWVVVLKAGTPQIMAMAAWRETSVAGEPGALCRANFHFRRFRDYPWYAVAYAARHETIRRLRAKTYVFAEPMPLHVASGWRITDTGISDEPGIERHRWFEMIRDPDPR